MVKYRTTCHVTESGTPLLYELVFAAEPFYSTPLPLRTVEIEPLYVYSVRDCRVHLAAEVIKDATTSVLLLIVDDDEMPHNVYEATLADIEEQGGAINISGIYRIDSDVVWRFIASDLVQGRVRAKLREIGVDVVNGGESDDERK